MLVASLGLINLAGAVAQLLWGIHMVQSGVQRAFGSDLRRILSRAFGNRLSAAAAGLCVTTVLQSSTAAGLMIVSFAANGLVALVPALAAMLGANIGTTLIVQVLSFHVSGVSPLLLIAGVTAFRARGTRAKDLGRIAIGLGFILLALSQLLEIVTPYQDFPGLRTFLGVISTDSIILTLFGAVIAWAAHSSAAVALLVMSLAAKGLLQLDAAIALMIGANIGAALNPFFERTRGGDPTGKRVALGNVATRLSGAIVALPLIPWIGRTLVEIEPDLPRAIADFHTGFNLAIALVMMPILTPFARLLDALLPRRIEENDPSRPLYLDEGVMETPAIALGHAAREALRMVDALHAMLDGAADSLRRPSRDLIARSRRQDDVLDKLNIQIKRYVARLDPDSLSDQEYRRLEAILVFAMNLESAGDVVERNILASASKKMKHGLRLSPGAESQVLEIFEAVRANLRCAAAVFMTGEPRAARALSEQKAEFRRREADAFRAHLEQFRESEGVYALPLDLVRDIKRINDHLIAGAAYPVLEASGDLMASRVIAVGEGKGA